MDTTKILFKFVLSVRQAVPYAILLICVLLVLLDSASTVRLSSVRVSARFDSSLITKLPIASHVLSTVILAITIKIVLHATLKQTSDNSTVFLSDVFRFKAISI